MDWQPPDTWTPLRDYLRGAMADLPSRPTGIVIVSAHWEAPRFTVATAERPGLLFDYSGFPPHTYELRYPAPGSPTLAARIRDGSPTRVCRTRRTTERGFDHGVFIPLLLMAPDADIPVVPLSLRTGLDPQEHAAAGRALQSLRDDGVFIVGSGMSYHNMRGYGRRESGPVSDRFDAWLTDAVAIADADERATRLAAWSDQPDGRASHPREEHLIPLMVVAGSAGASGGRRTFTGRVLETTVSAYRFD